MEKTVRGESRITMIPVFNITCIPARGRSYSRSELCALSHSIERNGILQPIIVRDVTPYEFELISGERRLRAAVMAGAVTVPCIILHCTRRQSAVYSLVENLQRDNDIFNRAEALSLLICELGFSREQAAQQLGISQRRVGQYLSILKFSENERRRITASGLELSQAAEISSIELPSERTAALEQALSRELEGGSSSIHRFIVKDMRLFYNTIDHAVRTMRRCGIAAKLESSESDSCIEYRIRIKKQK